MNETQNRNHVIGIFIDLKKALDTIDNYKMIIIKLEQNSIRGKTLKLLANYLNIMNS